MELVVFEFVFQFVFELIVLFELSPESEAPTKSYRALNRNSLFSPKVLGHRTRTFYNEERDCHRIKVKLMDLIGTQARNAIVCGLLFASRLPELVLPELVLLA